MLLEQILNALIERLYYRLDELSGRQRPGFPKAIKQYLLDHGVKEDLAIAIAGSSWEKPVHCGEITLQQIEFLMENLGLEADFEIKIHEVEAAAAEPFGDGDD